jgi:hypothetical protein
MTDGSSNNNNSKNNNALGHLLMTTKPQYVRLLFISPLNTVCFVVAALCTQAILMRPSRSITNAAATSCAKHRINVVPGSFVKNFHQLLQIADTDNFCAD